MEDCYQERWDTQRIEDYCFENLDKHLWLAGQNKYFTLTHTIINLEWKIIEKINA